MATFATGKYSKAFCGRCGLPWNYGDLREDGQVRGLRVCPDCWEPRHPQERPQKADDPIALRHPAPEVIADPSYEVTYPLYQVSSGTYFGMGLAVFTIDSGVVAFIPEPEAPTNLEATLTLAAAVSLSWIDNSTNETEFVIERCTGAACSGFAEIDTAPADSTAYVDSTAAEGQTYRYRVAARNAVGTSDYAGPVEIEILSINSEITAGTVYIAHRASGLLYPEETDVAYANAASDGTIVVEQDLRLNADGTLVCSHDATSDYITTTSASYSGLTEANIAALAVDSESYLGVAYPAAKVQLFSEVLGGYLHEAIFFPEIKDAAGAQTVTELQTAVVPYVQAVVSSFDVADLSEATTAGYKTMLASTGADVLATAQANNIDYLVYSKDSADARFTDAVTAGIPVFAYTVNRRYERDELLALGVSGMYSDDPVYVSGNAPLATTDDFASQAWSHGMIAGYATSELDNSRPTAVMRGRFFTPDYWGYDDSGLSEYRGTLQGWACPVASDPDNDTYSVEFKVTFDTPSSGTNLWAGMFIANSDRPFKDVDGSNPDGPDGYHFLTLRNGGLHLYRVDAPNTATLLGFNTDGSAISDGTETRFRVNVWANKLRLDRLDGSGNVQQMVTVGDMTAGHRGGYFHLGHKLLEAKFRDVTVGATPTNYWNLFDLATRPDVILSEDSFVNTSTWADISGNAHDFTQLTAARQPTQTAALFNGHRAARFDGLQTASGDKVANTTATMKDLLRNVSSAWGFVVYDKAAADGATTNRFIFRHEGASGSDTRFQIAANGTLGADTPQVFTRRTDSGTTSGVASTAGARTDQVMLLFVADYANDTGYLYIDGNAADTFAIAGTSGANTSDTASGTGSTIGGLLASDIANADVDIALLAIGADYVPTATEIDKMFGFAAHQYGLAANLPGGHPYKNDAPTVP